MKTDEDARRAVHVPPAETIRLVVSDVDGTLLTPNGQLTHATIAAVAKLREAGIPLCLVSARPPGGVRIWLEPLGITTPYGALNGAVISDGSGKVLSSLTMDPQAVRETIDMLSVHEVDMWLFCGPDWVLTNETAGYVQREKAAIRIDPTVVDDFSEWQDKVGKITGSSGNYELLGRMEAEIGALLQGRGNAACSAPWYLDITHPDANKGRALAELASMMGVEIHEVACLGDMDNDIPMLDRAGLSIAMGNATDEVASHAHFQTASNEDEGWSKAIERYILPRAAGTVDAAS